MTNWTKTNDINTSYIEVTDTATDYEKQEDTQVQWGFFGGLIRLVTEGYREELMTEGNTDYLVYSHGEDKEIWTDTSDISTVYTKISDI